MATLNQLIKTCRKKKKKKYQKPALKFSPHRKGVCVKVFTTKPKKPNSAIRKLARVKLDLNTIVTVAIPGQGHNLQKHSVVLIRGGRTRDVPGVKYKIIRGKYDCDTNENIIRTNALSKYGLKKLR